MAAGGGSSGEEVVKKVGDGGTVITLKVRGRDEKEVVYKMKRNTPMRYVLKLYCDKLKIHAKSMAFLFDGSRIGEEQTPDDLKMEDGDQVDAMHVQISKTDAVSNKRLKHTPSSLPSADTVSGVTSVLFDDIQVLNCSICALPLSIPVFCCADGHTLCSSCCESHTHSCLSCHSPLGKIRNQPLEKVLQSIRIACQNARYGCLELIIYSNKREHEQNCVYVPCFCPVTGCNFTGSYKQLYEHSTSNHSSSVTSFSFDCVFPVSISNIANGSFLLLQEKMDGVLFILQQNVEVFGNAITVSCLQPTSSKIKYFYELKMTNDGSSLMFQTPARNIISRFDKSISTEFLVSKTLLNSDGQLNLNLRIWH